MAKIQKIETTHYIYEYVLSDEELQMYLKDENAFWDEFDGDWGEPDMDVDSTPVEYNFYD
jgi:hypothetical protein